ncbi:MAG: aldo/keto reductase [Planctomycetes bacterium]|nr:aldo/keto reductase [Planctomycetota bacterium]
MDKRKLGRTGEELSVIGFGGIVVTNETPAAAARLVSEAIDRGINYFDVAPSYGNAEERLGPALKPYRESVFLACKTGQRKAAEAREELHRSLSRLCTDHLDLYQHHGVSTVQDAEEILGPGGAMETFLDAKEAGLIRYIGFSAHSEEAALLMLDRFPFDSVLFPVNFACWHQGHFGSRIMSRASELGVGRLALKALARRPWTEGEERKWPKCWYCPVDDLDDAKVAVRFALSKPITAAVGPSHAELLWLACDAASHFTPMSEEEESAIADKLSGEAIFPG